MEWLRELMSFGSPMDNVPAYAQPGYGQELTQQRAGLSNYMRGQTGGYNPLEIGYNIPTLQLGMQGLGAMGNLWGTFQSNKLAKDAFNFQKSMAEKNYANQLKSYNTALTDRATTRGFVQGDSTEKTQQYINDNKL